MKKLFKAVCCMIVGHDWRSDSNERKHCERCPKKQKRAFWDWNEWINDK